MSCNCKNHKVLNVYQDNFIDPMYAPYHDKEAHKINTQYPLVDSRRRPMGQRLSFRSQHEGYCPPGYVIGENNMCFEKEEESYGTFYTSKFKDPLIQ